MSDYRNCLKTPIPIFEEDLRSDKKLSRAEIRRLAKEKQKKATYNFTEEQLKEYVLKEVEAIMETVTENTSEMITELVLLYVMTTLHNKFGFGKTRLLRFREEVDILADCVGRDLIKNEELTMGLQEETGVELVLLKRLLGIVDSEYYAEQERLYGVSQNGGK